MNNPIKPPGDHIHLPWDLHGRTLIKNQADESQPRFWAWWQSLLRGSKFSNSELSKRLSAVDLFCGSGGLSLGAQIAARSIDAHLRILRAVDTDATALQTYSDNLAPAKAIQSSVASMVDYQLRTNNDNFCFAYPPTIIDERILTAKAPDLFLAGPPCQGHSNLNNHSRRDDPRNHLFVAATAIAIALHSRTIVIENVPGVQHASERVVEISRKLLEDAGYNVAEAVLSADKLGWPQTRSRLFLLASHSSIPNSRFITDTNFRRFSQSNPFSEKIVNPLRWAVEDLENIDSEDIFDSAPTPTAENRRRINYLFDHDIYDLPEKMRPDCHKNGTSYMSVYGRMNYEKPAPTITTGIGTPGQGRFIHPTQRRLITPHEAARIQSFPDWFDFTKHGTSRKDLAKWIGDAVPPFLGFAATIFALAPEIFDHQPSEEKNLEKDRIETEEILVV